MTGMLLSQALSHHGATVHRVLAIPEIVELVFSFLDLKDNAANARVCKTWCEVALDLLWRNVDDLPRLFRLLAPIVSDEAGTCFERPLEPTDWTRFMRYASRVRTLSITPSTDKQLRGMSVFDEVARTRTSLNMFPKLSSLSWDVDCGFRMRPLLLFMHESVKEFVVFFLESSTYSFGAFAEDIKLRMPKLTTLDLRFSFPVRDVEGDLCQLFKGLPRLRKVVMPKYTLTTKIIETLSELPTLSIIQFEFLEEQGSGDFADIADWHPVLQEGAFPALYDLNVSAELPQMLKFLHTPFFPCNLRMLCIHLISTSAPALVHEFLSAVSEECQLLEELYILFVGDPYPIVYSISRGAELADETVTWDTLRPILRCPKLKCFEFGWDSPLAISETDIEELASSWPSLEMLALNCEIPPWPTHTPLTLRALIPFARHCPNLRELSLYVSTSAVAPLPLPLPVPALTPFRSLRKLFVGLSRIGEADAEPVAHFLSQLCPLGCTVLGGVQLGNFLDVIAAATHEDQEVLSALLHETGEWFDRWAEVNRMLPLLTRVRMEERARREDLEREVEDLRIRCRLLEDRLDVGAGAVADNGCVLL